MASYQESVAVWRKLAEDRPAIALYREKLADNLKRLGNPQTQMDHLEEALASYGEALAISRKLAEVHPTEISQRRRLGSTLNNIGNVKLTSKPAEALAPLREAAAIFRQLVREHPAVTGFRQSLTLAQINAGFGLNSSGQ